MFLTIKRVNVTIKDHTRNICTKQIYSLLPQIKILQAFTEIMSILYFTFLTIKKNPSSYTCNDFYFFFGTFASTKRASNKNSMGYQKDYVHSLFFPYILYFTFPPIKKKPSSYTCNNFYFFFGTFAPTKSFSNKFYRLSQRLCPFFPLYFLLYISNS